MLAAMRVAPLALATLLLGCRGDDKPSDGGSGAVGLAYDLLARPDAKDVGPLEYLEVDELSASHRGKRVKVHGFVTEDEVQRSGDHMRWRFVMAQGGARLVVEHTGTLPDRFQQKLEV